MVPQWGVVREAPTPRKATAQCVASSPAALHPANLRVTLVAHGLGRMHGDVMNSEEVVFSVDGWPPAKNEAKSMLAAGHIHSDRVLRLLAAARTATRSRPSPVFGIDLVGLELIVHPPTEPPADATNFLGGVGDVLEAKERRGVLDRLGDLATVALYANDRQIREVSYRWRSESGTGYSVRVWRI